MSESYFPVLNYVSHVCTSYLSNIFLYSFYSKFYFYCIILFSKYDCLPWNAIFKRLNLFPRFLDTKFYHDTPLYFYSMFYYFPFKYGPPQLTSHIVLYTSYLYILIHIRHCFCGARLFLQQIYIAYNRLVTIAFIIV